ncbi:U-box domain-containing protein 29 [Linum perenne]
MGRDMQDLYITLPNLLRCPISLDVMKSPVSLSTGVTYDRSSIQKWLESGHDTCPATMQVLPNKDFVPNLTLLRLINIYNQSSSRRPASAVSHDQIRIWIHKLRSSIERKEPLLQLAEFAGCSAANRKVLVGIDGFLEAIVVSLSGKIDELELAVRILGLVSGENGVGGKLNRLLILQSGNRNQLLPLISILLEAKNSGSKVDAIRVLDSISIDNQSKRFVSETENLVPILFLLLRQESDDLKLHDAVFSLLISIAVTRSLRGRLVELGLVSFLSRTVTNRNAKAPLAEKSLKLLSILSTCPEGRSAISEDTNCVGGIVERLMKVSKAATEDAVAVLWSTCCLFNDRTVAEKAVKNHGVTKVLLVMQSEVEGNVKAMCRELVKAFRAACTGNGCGGVESYNTKTTHIMPY